MSVYHALLGHLLLKEALVILLNAWNVLLVEFVTLVVFIMLHRQFYVRTEKFVIQVLE